MSGLTTIRYLDIKGATGTPQELIAIDVNHDGYLDLVGAGLYYPLKNAEVPVFVLLNDKAGGFAAGPSKLVSGGPAGTVHPREMIKGDFNGDGIDDLFIADHGYDAAPFPGHANTLLLGKASGGFVEASANLPKIADFTHSATAADIDGDGDLDLYVGNINGGKSGPYLLINDGSAHFVRSSAGLPSDVAGRADTYTTSLFLDVDRDGDQDLFLGSDSGSPALLMNNGKGRFSEGPKFVPEGAFGAGKTITVDSKSFDFNRDGKADILTVATRADPFYQGARLQVLLSDGKGGFSDKSKLYFDSQPATKGWVKYVEFVDLNNDGALDIIGELSGGASGVIAYLNGGNNQFYQLRPDALSKDSKPVEIMDLDNDGTPELVQVINYNGSYSLSIIDLQLTPGNVTGTSKADTIFGTARSQTIDGAAGNDFLSGGNGNDTLIGGAGADKLLGGGGVDTASYSTATKGVVADLKTPSLNTNDAKGDVYSSIENLAGSKYSDKLTGNDLANRIDGGGGSDRLYGGGGNDRLYGGAGNDILWGGAGNDTLYAGDGSDALAPAGNNTLNGGAGDDYLVGGDGKDVFVIGAGEGDDHISDFEYDRNDKIDLKGQTYEVEYIGDHSVGLLLSGGGRLIIGTYDVPMTPEDSWFL